MDKRVPLFEYETFAVRRPKCAQNNYSIKKHER